MELEINEGKNGPTLDKTLTSEDIRRAIGRTYFGMEDDDSHILLDTRSNGDVGSETPGEPDIEEGKRILKSLRENFPHHHSGIETVDEWVHVSIRKAPKSEREIREAAFETKRVQLTKKLSPSLGAAILAVNQKILGVENLKAPASANLAHPFYWDGKIMAERPTPETFGRPVLQIRSKFGERLRYRDHLGAIPAFKTPEEAMEKLPELLAALGGEIVGTPGKEGPYERETYNYRPPNNIIERVGTITFSVALPKA
jgi:hypothetical protein